MSSFDPSKCIDDEAVQGSFENDALSVVLSRLHKAKVTGALRTFGEEGVNSLFFRDGQACGANTVTEAAPLGMVLLEMNLIDRNSYDEAEQQVVYLSREPEAVYRELGLLDDERMAQVNQVQAIRRARNFIDTCSGDYEWGHGISFLVGFSSAIIPIDLVVVKAMTRDFTLADREAYMQNFGTRQVMASQGLVEPLSLYDMGAPEKDLLDYLKEWRGVDELQKRAFTARHELSFMLRALELLGRLEVRIKPELSNPRIIPEDLANKGEFSPRMGWKDPRPVRVERNVDEAPSIVIDMGALGVDPEDDKNG